jgi:dGTPase
MSQLSWEKLLTQTRARSSQKQEVDHRSEADRDYDRVVFSSSFRRLQDKTQVWPLEAHDFVRTRLTHSCEVATIGRSLVKGVFGELPELKALSVDPNEPATSVATACLLHDIGNPPFGHTGEDHIARWFEKLFADESGLDLTEREKLDLSQFEGNAHAFRVATRLQTLGDSDGMNLTFGTLSAMIKYPYSSSDAPKKAGKKLKFGVFASEQNKFERVREETGLTGNMRHPLAHLVEAADDIAYSVVDVEDGLKKATFSFGGFVDAGKSDNDVSSFIQEYLVDKYDRLTCGGTPSERQQLAFQLFRVFTIGHLTGAVVRTFSDHYADIMNGQIPGDLVSLCELNSLVKFLKSFAQDEVYTASAVVKTERAAKKIVGGLLDILWDENRKRRAGGTSKLLNALLRNIAVDGPHGSPDYISCQLLADYVAGMTDTFAQTLYVSLTGGADKCGVKLSATPVELR